ncbi:MAG: NAD-dependent epimerase/dehydratase family protein, partial [Alphaproteobacteria bacterium]|nr:NAD-dependent epimerase/dehydratase family protein [Alphaproteobacteria bacterium]
MSQVAAPGADRVLLTGATGYVGGRLLPLLQARGVQVRCLARDPARLQALAGPSTEIVAGDVLDPGSLDRALQGIHTAYYLVHLMSGSADFEQDDREAANCFASAARKAVVKRIIYLGGLG